ncbi:MAG: hypothetical protein DLM57_16260 [Pseudonocardiales bacterium]|nr:MAG: hypothetical protein DLM57_16260 [Pseudonocardiales bacterium]
MSTVRRAFGIPLDVICRAQSDDHRGPMRSAVDGSTFGGQIGPDDDVIRPGSGLLPRSHWTA